MLVALAFPAELFFGEPYDPDNADELLDDTLETLGVIVEAPIIAELDSGIPMIIVPDADENMPLGVVALNTDVVLL